MDVGGARHPTYLVDRPYARDSVPTTADRERMLERIQFILPGFPANEGDTSCLPAVQTYVRAFARLRPKADVRVLTLHYPYSDRAYSWHGVRIRSLGGSNRRGIGKALLWHRAMRHIHLRPGTLIHSFWLGECALLAAIAAHRHCCAHVATIGGQELRHPTVYSRILRHLRFDLIGASEQAAATAHRTLGRTPDRIIPLGIDPDDVKRARDASAWAKRDVDVFTAASLTPLKRVGDVLAVAERLPFARFAVAGDGPLRGELEHTAPSNLTFLGHLPRQDVLQWMQRSRILLHPSEFESQGFVFLEALASGLHVVCRDVGSPGPSHKVHRCQSVDEMAGKIEAILDKPADFEPVQVPIAAETVQQYSIAYEQALLRLTEQLRRNQPAQLAAPEVDV